MDNSFTIGGREFKLRKLDAFKQFHIVRRMGPVLADLALAIQGMDAKKINDSSVSESEKLGQLAKFVSPIMNGMSKLSDKEADEVLYGLLSCAEIKHGQGWVSVSNGSVLMMGDLDLPILLQVAGRAFMYNLSGFFPAPQQSL